MSGPNAECPGNLRRSLKVQSLIGKEFHRHLIELWDPPVERRDAAGWWDECAFYFHYSKPFWLEIGTSLQRMSKALVRMWSSWRPIWNALCSDGGKNEEVLVDQWTWDWPPRWESGPRRPTVREGEFLGGQFRHWLERRPKLLSLIFPT